VRIDDRAEEIVRHLFETVVNEDEAGLDAALRSFPDDETRVAAVRLAVAICQFAVLDENGGMPSDRQLGQLAESLADVASWSIAKPDEVRTFLTGVMRDQPVVPPLDPTVAYALTFIVAGTMLASSAKVGPDEWWFDYLDRVEAVLESMPDKGWVAPAVD
jgi:hypothetical protein